MSDRTILETIGQAVGLSTESRPAMPRPARAEPAHPGDMLSIALRRVDAVRKAVPAGSTYANLARLEQATRTLGAIRPPRDAEAEAIRVLAVVRALLVDYARLPAGFGSRRALGDNGRTAADHLAAALDAHAGRMESIVEAVGVQRAGRIVQAADAAATWPGFEPGPEPDAAEPEQPVIPWAALLLAALAAAAIALLSRCGASPDHAVQVLPVVTLWRSP